MSDGSTQRKGFAAGLLRRLGVSGAKKDTGEPSLAALLDDADAVARQAPGQHRKACAEMESAASRLASGPLTQQTPGASAQATGTDAPRRALTSTSPRRLG